MFPCNYCERTYKHVSGKSRHEREKHRPPREQKVKTPCVECGRKMRSTRTNKSNAPDTVPYGAFGKCSTCYNHDTGARTKRAKTYPCKKCSRLLRARGYTKQQLPGTLTHAACGLCHRCWRQQKNAGAAHYLTKEDRIDLTAAAQVRRLVEARYTGEQRKHMLDILGIGGDL